MENPEEKAPEPTELELKEQKIRKEYFQKCAIAGELQFKISMMQKDLESVNVDLRNLNIDAQKLDKEKQKASPA